MAELINQQPPTSVMNTKALLKSGSHDALEVVMQVEGELFQMALESDEAKDAFMKFLASKSEKKG